MLFRYWDGRRWRRADPFRLWRELFARNSIADLYGPAVEGREPETTELLERLCQVFGVQRWDERTRQGLTDWEIFSLLGQFHEYLEALKKSISPGLISPPPGDSASGTGPAAPDGATKASSPSWSSPSEPSSAAVTAN